MADYTVDQYRAGAKKALAAGDVAAAKRLIAAGRALEAKTQPSPQQSGAQSVPAMGLPENPELQMRGPGPTGAIDPALYDQGILPRRFMAGVGDQSGMADVSGAFAAGVGRGVTGILDLPGALLEMGSGAAMRGLEGAGAIGPETRARGETAIDAIRRVVPGLGKAREAAAKLTGGASEYRGEGTAAQYAGTIGEFLPGAVIPAKGVGDVLKYGVVPALASEAAGQATDGTAMEPYARLAAGILAPIGLGLAERVGRRAVTPYPADAERLKLADTLKDAGVPVTAGQRVGSDRLRRAEGSTQVGQDLNDVQAQAFTSAALKTIGTNAERATPDVLNATADRIGSVFNQVANGVSVKPSAKTMNDLSAAMHTYRLQMPPKDAPAIFTGLQQEMGKAVRSGTPIPADLVMVWRSTLSKMTRSADGPTRDAAIAAMDAVDASLDDALTALGRAPDVARLAEARNQWRGFLAIEKAASGAGENAAVGLLSPQALRSAVKTQGASAYARGKRGDLGDLSRAGAGVISKLPTSGTAENLRAMGLPSMMGAGAGGGIAAAMGMSPTVGAMIGAAAPPAVNAAKMTAPLQAYYANQLLGRGGPVVKPVNLLGPLSGALQR
jgi:hypothetical protein